MNARSYYADVLASMHPDAIHRDGGGPIAAPLPPLMSLPAGQGGQPGEIGPGVAPPFTGVFAPPPPEPTLPPVTTVHMTPEDIKRANEFLSTPIQYGSTKPSGADIFGTPAPAPSGVNPFGSGAQDVTAALERGGLKPGMSEADAYNALLATGKRTTDANGQLAPPSYMQQVNAAMGPPASAAPAEPQYVMRPGSGMGANVPAKETEMRGPTLLRAQGAANEAAGNAIQSVGDRTMQAANAEYEASRMHAAQAYAREDAAMESAAQREQELQARQADFDQSVKQLSAAHLDPDRFWASRSTPQKLAGIISITLGGFLQGARGGSNPGMDIINTSIDRDLKAQEFAYNAAKDAATAKQTAFGMAMSKYQNVDAARAVARASALDAVQAQMAQAAALYKGTDAANRADIAMAQLQRDKEAQIAQGIAFVPAHTVVAPRQFVDKNTGLIYSEAEMKGLLAKQGEYAHDLTKQQLGQEGTLRTEVIKGAIEQGKTAQGRSVQIPGGAIVQAPSDTEAAKLRDLSAAATSIDSLVSRAQTIRGDSTWRASPSARQELENIQARLATSFSTAANLGALSKDDLRLAEEATGDLFTLNPGVDAKLNAYRQQANTAVTDRVKTIPGASSQSKGAMPASFTQHGGK